MGEKIKWSNKMEIKRDYYLNKLIEHKHNGFIKIVSSVRRCGKSYLLFELFKKHLLDNGVKENHIITIALIVIKRPKINEYIFNYKNKPIRDVKKSLHSSTEKSKSSLQVFSHPPSYNRHLAHCKQNRCSRCSKNSRTF